MGKIVIVGAGIAGLTLAYQLSKEGKEVILIEKEKAVGGLSKSFHYDDFIFDIGPHRFHTDNKEVMDFILEVLKDDKIIIPRSSGVWMFDKYFDWPLKRNALFKLPFHIMVKSGLDLFTKPKMKGNSFEDYILSRYGKTLYKIFFKPYTEKFLKYDCSQIHRDWAQAGVDRAVIDKRVKMDSLFDVIKNTLLPKPVDTKFYYPKTGGIDVFSERLKEMITDNKGKVLTASEVTSITTEKGKITEITINNKEKVKPELLIWSGPVDTATKLLGLPDPKLEYLSVVCCNVMLDAPPRINYQWTYYGGDTTVFNRVSIPTLFNKITAPKGKSGICVELACMENDIVWKNPEHLRTPIEESLLKVGLIRRFNDIIDMKFERIKNTYPIYTLEYPKKLELMTKNLDKFENLIMLGRTGTFWYNNMDHSIKQALDISKTILNKQKVKTKRDFF